MNLKASRYIPLILLVAALAANGLALVALTENSQGEFCTPEGVDTTYLFQSWCVWFGFIAIAVGVPVAVAVRLLNRSLGAGAAPADPEESA